MFFPLRYGSCCSAHAPSQGQVAAQLPVSPTFLQAALGFYDSTGSTTPSSLLTEVASQQLKCSTNSNDEKKWMSFRKHRNNGVVDCTVHILLVRIFENLQILHFIQGFINILIEEALLPIFILLKECREELRFHFLFKG